MANEVLYSGVSDARLSAVLSASMDEVLADRASLWGSPAIKYYGSAAQRGSTAIKVPIPSLNGVNRMAAIAENASTSNTALTLTSATITIARQALQRQASDLFNLTDSVGLNLEAFITDMYGAASMRFMEMIANVADDFTATVGTTTVDMSVDDWFSADFTLTQASAPGAAQRMALLYPVQVTDLRNSMRAESGMFSMRSDVQGWLEAAGQGPQGSFLGVPIFASTLVPTANAGADSAGAMFAIGAIGYADGIPTAIRGAGDVVFPAGSRCYVELERDAAGALTKVVGNLFVGVSIIQQGLGVSIITDR